MNELVDVSSKRLKASSDGDGDGEGGAGGVEQERRSGHDGHDVKGKKCEGSCHWAVLRLPGCSDLLYRCSPH